MDPEKNESSGMTLNQELLSVEERNNLQRMKDNINFTHVKLERSQLEVSVAELQYQNLLLQYYIKYQVNA